MPAKKKAAVKAPAKKAAKNKPAAKVKAIEDTEEKKSLNQKECEHCLGTGKCTAGEPYDKGHHQMFGSKVIMTSCVDCLEAAGEHKNSKKLVKCHLCGGTGMVDA